MSRRIIWSPPAVQFNCSAVGLRAARFFTVWCFSGVTVFFALGAARRMEAVQEVTLFCTVAPPSLLTAAVFWLVIFPSLPPYLQRHAFRCVRVQTARHC